MTTKVDMNVCRKTQGIAEPGNTCLTTPGTCESCPDWNRRKFKLSVPMVPPSPNEIRRKYRHPKVYMNLRKVWEVSLAAAAGSADNFHYIRRIAAEQKMRVQVTVWHNRDFDPDNLQGCQKVVLDALKNIGFIRNDSSKWVELIPPTQFHGYDAVETVVMLEAK